MNWFRVFRRPVTTRQRPGGRPDRPLHHVQPHPESRRRGLDGRRVARGGRSGEAAAVPTAVRAAATEAGT